MPTLAAALFRSHGTPPRAHAAPRRLSHEPLDLACDVILEGMGVHQVEPPYKAAGWDLLRRRAMHRPPIKPRRTQRARPNHALMRVQPTIGQLPAIRTPSSECQHLPAPRQLPPYGIVASVFITATTLTTAPDTVTSILATEPFALASTRATGRIDAYLMLVS